MGIICRSRRYSASVRVSDFVLGVIVMRAAGCVINDYADRHIDGEVKRTSQRPLATGRVTTTEAKILFVLLLCIAFVLDLLLNRYAFYCRLLR
ncbi:4-hydroxybenzoate octaprenyltransferase [Actinobacillus equuli]|nr:4-hydroxybenzoate octaprenyltransferase [Actinobacillus equuli]